MKNVTGLNEYYFSKEFEFIEKGEYGERGVVSLVVEHKPKEGAKAYLTDNEIELSFEQLNDLFQIVAEEAYRMGKEHLDD